MPLTTLLLVVLVLVLIGAGLYLINTRIPMAGGIKTLLNVVVVVAVIYWLLKVFNLLGSLANITS